MSAIDLALEVLRGFVLPVVVSIATSILTIFGFERFKAAENFSTLLHNLRREMKVAERAHEINIPAAKHLTGGFVLYPMQVTEKLLFDPQYSNRVSTELAEALQGYLEEALRLNSFIENAKLAIGAGINLAKIDVSGTATGPLKEHIVDKPTVSELIVRIQKLIPR